MKILSALFLGVLLSLQSFAADSVLSSRIVFSGANLTPAWTLLTASLPAQGSFLVAYNSATTAVSLGVGKSGSEGTVIYLPPQSTIQIPLTLSRAGRLSINSVSGTISTGELDLFFLGDKQF